LERIFEILEDFYIIVLKGLMMAVVVTPSYHLESLELLGKFEILWNNKLNILPGDF
jgi:hypothetical protein